MTIAVAARRRASSDSNGLVMVLFKSLNASLTAVFFDLVPKGLPFLFPDCPALNCVVILFEPYGKLVGNKRLMINRSENPRRCHS